MNYYNEFEPTAAAWLRELVANGLIPNGDVDERDLRDVRPVDIAGYTQCHFFAGIGGWSLALQLADWPSDRPIWSGSPPCQPFSSAGKQKGKDDERHLWPVFFDLIRECRPPAVVGEQVSSAIGHGWLDDLSHDLEAEGYAAAAVVLPACSVGSPHIRQRLFYVAQRVAHTNCEGWGQIGLHAECNSKANKGWKRDRFSNGGANGLEGGMACCGLADCDNRSERLVKRSCQQMAGRREIESSHGPELRSAVSRMADAAPSGRGEECQDGRGRDFGDSAQGRAAGHGAGCGDSGLADTNDEQRPQFPYGERQGYKPRFTDCSDSSRVGNAMQPGLQRTLHFPGAQQAIEFKPGLDPWTVSATKPTDSHHPGWSDPDWLFCRDGKWRPVESGTFPLAHGVSARVVPSGDQCSAEDAQATAEARVMRLRGYGNAIVPGIAAEVIRCLMDEKQ